MKNDRSEEFEPISLSSVPLEELRDVVTALFEHLGITLECRERYYDGNEYRFVKKE